MSSKGLGEAPLIHTQNFLENFYTLMPRYFCYYSIVIFIVGVALRSVISIDFLCVLFAAADDLVGYFPWVAEVLSFRTRLHSSSIVITSRLVGTSCRTSPSCLHLRVGGARALELKHAHHGCDAPAGYPWA